MVLGGVLLGLGVLSVTLFLAVRLRQHRKSSAAQVHRRPRLASLVCLVCPTWMGRGLSTGMWSCLDLMVRLPSIVKGARRSRAVRSVRFKAKM